MKMPRSSSFVGIAVAVWIVVCALAALAAVFVDGAVAAVIVGTAVCVSTALYLYRRLLKRIMTTLKDGRAYSERRTEALFSLHELCRPTVALPFLRGWAATPDFVLDVILRAQRFAEPTIVECGSGVSTLWLGLWLQRRGQGRLVSLEHDGPYADHIRELVAEAGAQQFVEVVHAPLVDHTIGGTNWSWYSLDAVPDIPIDVLIVDGPPNWIHPQVRFPAVPLLDSRLSSRSVVFLHDTGRPGEQRVLADWLASHPQWHAEKIDTEKGGAVVTSAPVGSAVGG